MNYHGIVVDKSQKDQAIFKHLKILGKKHLNSSGWVLYKLEVAPVDLERTITALKQNMVDDPYYFHFYRGEELIVVFKDMNFGITTDSSTWKEAIDYGRKLNIPLEQLDFTPCRIEDETF